jgi:hypothetical protein
MKRWADSVIKTSEEDRHRLWDEVKEVDKEVQSLAGLVTKFQWWFIGILVAIIISSYAMPKLTANGTHKSFEELNGKINIIMEKQDAFDNVLNAVRYDQERRQAKEK